MIITFVYLRYAEWSNASNLAEYLHYFQANEKHSVTDVPWNRDRNVLIITFMWVMGFLFVFRGVHLFFWTGNFVVFQCFSVVVF